MHIRRIATHGNEMEVAVGRVSHGTLKAGPRHWVAVLIRPRAGHINPCAYQLIYGGTCSSAPGSPLQRLISLKKPNGQASSTRYLGTSVRQLV